MAGRSNACSELTRFWLEARHACLVTESVPVPVRYAQSDLDLVAIQSGLKQIVLPDGTTAGPRLIIETKDEHDWNPSGREFRKLLDGDLALLGDQVAIPEGAPAKPKFSMLRVEHYQVATNLFGTEDFDRLFVVHALDPVLEPSLRAALAEKRIHWLTIRDVVLDLREWYRAHLRPAGLRHSLMGDTLHLLFGFLGL